MKMLLAFSIAAVWLLTTTQPSNAGDGDSISQITHNLDSSDPAIRQDAVTSIQSRISDDPEQYAVAMANQWCKPLLRLKLYDDVTNWALIETCVPANPALSIQQLEELQLARVNAFLAAGKSKEALSAAKSYFNVCRMQQTGFALHLLDKCLAADPQTVKLIDQLTQEEKAGATAATQPSEPCVSQVLRSIQVDPSPYKPWIEKEDGKTVRSCVRRGNRFLLADLPTDARKEFEMALTMSKSENSEIINSIARSIRAEDGTIGRANAYILAHYPASTQPTN